MNENKHIHNNLLCSDIDQHLVKNHKLWKVATTELILLKLNRDMIYLKKFASKIIYSGTATHYNGNSMYLPNLSIMSRMQHKRNFI